MNKIIPKLRAIVSVAFAASAEAAEQSTPVADESVHVGLEQSPEQMLTDRNFKCLRN